MKKTNGHMHRTGLKSAGLVSFVGVRAKDWKVICPCRKRAALSLLD
ncbi:hypothetical protein [Pedobacter sp. R-06]